MAEEKAKAMKIFCPLCHQVFEDPYIATCGVSNIHNNGGVGCGHWVWPVSGCG